MAIGAPIRSWNGMPAAACCVLGNRHCVSHDLKSRKFPSTLRTSVKRAIASTGAPFRKGR